MVSEAVKAVRLQVDLEPRLAVVTGSGLADIAERVTDATTIAYRDIPGHPVSTVEGHPGELVFGRLGETPVVIARGRCHLYEGFSPVEVTFGVRLMRALGAQVLVVTNAAGGLAPEFRAGDVMVIADHLFFPGMAGSNPLVGPNDASVGPRFPGMWNAYDPVLRAQAKQALRRARFAVHEGVYAMVAGPSFETPAEARALRALGADAVGMSTAPEVVAARHMDMRVVGFSLITNRVRLEPPSLDEGLAPDLHEEVMSVGLSAAGRLAQALEEICRAL